MADSWRLRRPPATLPLRRPACLLATWFGAGLLPGAPGTWGSLAALPFGVAILALSGPWALAGAAAILFLAGLWATRIYLAASGEDDPGPIVVDEVVGQFVAMLLIAPEKPLQLALAFLLFRAFDIWKPWPISWCERAMPSALGVMVDDVLAGIFALCAFALVAILGV